MSVFKCDTYIITVRQQISIFICYTAVADKIEELEDLLQRLEEFQDNMRESESTLDRYKDKLDTHLKQGSSAKDPKHIDKIKVNKLQYEYQNNYLTFYYF